MIQNMVIDKDVEDLDFMKEYNNNLNMEKSLKIEKEKSLKKSIEDANQELMKTMKSEKQKSSTFKSMMSSINEDHPLMGAKREKTLEGDTHRPLINED